MPLTLTNAPLAPLLDRLFEQAEQATSPAMTGLPREERERPDAQQNRIPRLLQPRQDLWLPVSRDRRAAVPTGTQHERAQHRRIRHIVWALDSVPAAALRDNGGGRLIGSEFEPSKVMKARQNLVEGGDDLVEIREGDALKTLAADLPESIDLLLLDGAKSIYCEVLDLVESRLRPGALIVADNADYSPDYLARVRSPESGYLSVPFGEDVELSIRLG